MALSSRCLVFWFLTLKHTDQSQAKLTRLPQSRMVRKLTMESSKLNHWLQLGFRFALCTWLVAGHGTPKLVSWIFGIETWGPHAHFAPKGFFSGLAAMIEFLCPLMIIFGFKIRWNAIAVAAMFSLSALSLPFPWIHEKVMVAGSAVPFAIVMSKEIHFVYALAYLSLLFFSPNKTKPRKSRA